MLSSSDCSNWMSEVGIRSASLEGEEIGKVSGKREVMRCASAGKDAPFMLDDVCAEIEADAPAPAEEEAAAEADAATTQDEQA